MRRAFWLRIVVGGSVTVVFGLAALGAYAQGTHAPAPVAVEALPSPVPSIAISDTGALLLALGMMGSAVILRRRL